MLVVHLASAAKGGRKASKRARIQPGEHRLSTGQPGLGKGTSAFGRQVVFQRLRVPSQPGVVDGSVVFQKEYGPWYRMRWTSQMMLICDWSSTMSKAIPMGPRPSLQPGTMRPQRLWRLGWIMAYIVLPFGKLSILGLLPLLGARLWQWRRGTDEAPPSNPLVIWANRLILSLLVLAALSAVFSSKPWLALTKVLAFGLMLYVYYFGAQSSAHAFGGCLLRTCYPLLMISGVITCIVSLVNCYYSGDMARAASFSSGPNSFATILIMLAGLGTGRGIGDGSAVGVDLDVPQSSRTHRGHSQFRHLRTLRTDAAPVGHGHSRVGRTRAGR